MSPEEAPVSWLGFLYSILTLASIPYLDSNGFEQRYVKLSLLIRAISNELSSRDMFLEPAQSPEPQNHVFGARLLRCTTFTMLTSGNSSINIKAAEDTVRAYRESCVQCLLLSDYTKPGSHTIECLIIYMESEFLMSEHDQVHCYLLVGNTARLAMRMGMHRDAQKISGKLSPFQGEMRRRIWHYLVQVDLLSSFHIGLPGIIQSVESDTQLPSNLRDEDFHEDSPKIPPPRPESELTPMSYTICKSRLCEVCGKISIVANKLQPPSYEQVLDLDRQLQHAHSLVPSFFQLKHSQIFVTESSDHVLKRFSIALTYQKSRCMLHRSFMLRDKEHPEYLFSKTAAQESAMELLRNQSMIHDAALPGGPIARDRWFISSLSVHDFLLAAMIIYISIKQDLKETRSGSKESDIRERLEALERSRNIWKQSSTTPTKARSAISVLDAMITKVHLVTGQQDQPRGSQLSRDSGVTKKSFDVDNLEALWDESLNMSYDSQPRKLFPIIESTAPSAPHSFNQSPSIIPDSTVMDTETFDKFTNFPDDFDWTMFDNELRPQELPGETWPDLGNDIWEGYNELS